ncbi:stalk domain-containing protein [Paenibacillus albus]|uniref:Copper amine oxidase-like N-terminal domain-containing protein n=1 Tax=Paenibacillus albus TaxID=2495582 RepID=A0A3Q8X8B3_9BACL|nr:stalk domain-containing protein [Paenibacillus albus]AZN42766.1 hypothetical protein EJC50_26050 [Paenibacillus albus]
MKKKSMIALLSATALLSMTTGAFAATTSTAIKAVLDGTLHFKKDGKDWQPTDANGKKQLPITYKGTTYLPLRSTADALGVPLKYDAATKTVSLGESGTAATNKRVTFYDKHIKKVKDMTVKFNDVINKAQLVFDGKQYNGAYSFAVYHTEDYYLTFDFGAKYKTLHLIVAPEVDMKMKVYNGDKQQLSDEITLYKGEVTEVDIDLQGSQQAMIYGYGVDYGKDVFLNILKDSYVTNEPIPGPGLTPPDDLGTTIH